MRAVLIGALIPCSAAGGRWRMPRNGGNWLQLLRSRLGVGEVGIDLPTALEYPDPVIRVLAAGVVWGRTGGRQPALVMPHIEAAIRSREHWGLVFGCQLLAAMGPAAES